MNVNINAMSILGEKKEQQDGVLIISKRLGMILSNVIGSNALGCIASFVDTIDVDDDMLLFAVTDGVSSSQRPQATIRIIQECLIQFVDTVVELNREAFDSLLDTIVSKIYELKELGAATLSLMILHNGKIHLLNVGDSPIYRFNEVYAEKSYVNHTVYDEAMANPNRYLKKLREKKLRKYKHTLSKWIPTKIKNYHYRVVDWNGDGYLLASDGFHEMYIDIDSQDMNLMNVLLDETPVETLYKNRDLDPMDNTTIVIVKEENSW